MKNKLFAGNLLLLTILGFLVVLFVTRWGIGVSPDSVAYIGGARNLVAGNGLSLLGGTGSYDPVTHHAPLYSFLLSLPGFLGIDPGQAARVLNALLFSANILILGILAVSLTEQKFPLIGVIPTAGAFLLFISPIMVEIHLMAWTEPVFIMLVLVCLGSLGAYIKKTHWSLLIGSGLAASLAFLTRYAGISIIITGVLGLLLFLPGSLLNRIKTAAVFCGLGLTPVFLWISRNVLTAGTAANRDFIFHPISKTQLWVGLTTTSGWFGVPESASTILKLVPITGSGLVFLALIILARKTKRSFVNGEKTVESTQTPIIIKLSLVFLPVYLAFLVFSISFFDANTPLDSRILSPVFVISLLLALYGAASFFSLPRNYWPVKISLLLFGLGLSINYTLASVNLLMDSYRNGIGLNSVAWLESETLKELDKYPPETVIYTNAPDAVYLQIGRPALALPRKFVSTSQRENSDYAADVAAMKNQVEKNQALIVYFSTLNRPNTTTEEELRHELSLEVFALLSDGTIFGPGKSAGIQ